MKIVSIKDELELTEDSVIIRKRGMANAMAAGMNGDRSIPVAAITAVQLKLGGWTPGYILFSYAGSKPFSGGLIEATQDPDAFIFNKSFNDQVQAFKAKVEESMRKSRRPQAATVSMADELQKLATLKSQGILSQAEFDTAKAKLLS